MFHSHSNQERKKERILTISGVFMLAMSCGDESGDPARNIRWADEVIAYSTQYDSIEWPLFPPYI